MQKINILGVALTDYSLKESLNLVDDFMKSGALNTILYVTTPMLIMAGKDGQEKERIESMDLTLCGDVDILKVARIESMSRLYEVENLIFLKEFLRRIERFGKTVYLLSDSREGVETLKKDLAMFQKGIIISGSGVAGEEEENIKEMVNKINDVAPVVIISHMPLEKQERWMTESKPFLNAEVWLGISNDMKFGEAGETLRKKMMGKIYRKMFHNSMNRYNNEKEEK